MNLPPLPMRDPGGHKGTFGTVSVIGGCATSDQIMAGAPALAALGAFRSGCGLVRLLVPQPVAQIALAVCPSATCALLATSDRGMIIPSDACGAFDAAASTSQCVVIGPGMGSDPAVATLTLRALQQQSAPVVVDADAINALATIPDLHLDLRASAVLTPHPGEFRRLASVLRITHDPTDASSRPSAAAEMAQKLGVIVVLKGRGTVVSNGLETWTCTHGHAALATAGSGDVLAGIIAGIIAQHVGTASTPRRAGAALTLLDAVRIAVFAHARAGERWAASHRASGGMLATDLAHEIPAILAELEARAP
ncbi:MAG: NAD(P)H-hydrate dehydratase [Phycisphaeraceae bacterium]|nr:MAG: NAD(P)H-hydrate dehydratase [Phycisphaeraceae bacterium]